MPEVPDVPEVPEVILYPCQVCDSIGNRAEDLTWYFRGAEQLSNDDEPSKPAWYCTTCVASRRFHSGPDYTGPRLDIAIIDHVKNML